MSHGTYMFLFDDEALSDNNKATVNDALAFRYANTHCTENNWYDPLFIARPGRRTVAFRPDRDPAPYEELLLNAWGIAIHDLRLIEGVPALSFGEDPDLTKVFEELKSRGPRYLDWLVRNQVPRRIAAAFVPGEPRTHDIRFTDAGFERYKRESLTAAYRCYGASYIPPFAQYLCPPEEWRLFDLREETFGDERYSNKVLDGAVLVGVDIHT